MAWLFTCCSSCQNPPPPGKDKLTDAALTEGSGIFIPILVVLRAPTPAPIISSTITLFSNNKLFKQFMKAYLESQVPGQTKLDPEPCKQPFKAWFPDLYYGNLYMDCDQFCQQFENHFITAKAKEPNRIPFAALFMYGSVTQQWLQHKQCCENAVPMTWIEFKDFFQKNLGDSKTFVDSIWKKVKRNSQN